MPGPKKNRVKIEYLQVAVSGDLAYTVQLERRQLSVPGQNEPIGSVLRATDVFREGINGAWQLLHRHADPLFVEVVVPGLPTPQR